MFGGLQRDPLSDFALRQLWKYPFFVILLFILGGCSTMNHHKLGHYYSGVDRVGEYSRPSYGPNGAIGVGALFIPVIDGFRVVVYNPIDFIFSGTADTVMLPLDLAYHDSVKAKEKKAEALAHGNQSYAIPRYVAGEYILEEPLITAICKDDYNMTKNIITESPHLLEREDKFRHMPMDYAIRMHHFTLVDLLIEEGVPNDLLYLQVISNSVDYDIFKNLLETDVKEHDLFETPALAYAVESNRSNIVALLLEQEDVNINTARYSYGSEEGTVLMTAVLKNNYEVVKQLIDAGIYLNAEDARGYTAHQYTKYVRGDTTAIVKLLQQAGVKKNQALPFFPRNERFRDSESSVVEDRTEGLIFEDTRFLYRSVGERYKRDDFTYEEAKNYCENSTHAGYDDWKIPSAYTMLGIMQSDIFKNKDESYYWSLTTENNITTLYGTYEHGAVEDLNRRHGIRCVRGEKRAKSLRYDDRLGVIIDANTQTMWQNQYKFERQRPRQWQASINYCESLKLAGFEDWHLPTTLLFQKFNYLEQLLPTQEQRGEVYWSTDTEIYDDKKRYVVVDVKSNEDYWHDIDKSDENLAFVRCARSIEINSTK